MSYRRRDGYWPPPPPGDHQRMPHDVRPPAFPDVPIPQPPQPHREEPWFDTRFRGPDEAPHDRVGAGYRGGPDPNYQPQDYVEPPSAPGPRPTMFDGRAFDRSRPAPATRPPTYRDTVRMGKLLGPFWEPTDPEGDFDADAGVPTYEQGLLSDAGWQQLTAQGFGAPPDAPPDPAAPAMDPGPDLETLVNDHFPPVDDAGALAAEYDAFAAEMQQAWAPPEPSFPPMLDDLGGLEQRLMEPPEPPLAPPFPDIPFM